MFKQIATKNQKAREKAGDQPYYKITLDYERACPYCDELLKNGIYYMDMRCECGTWNNKGIGSNNYIYIPKEGKE